MQLDSVDLLVNTYLHYGYLPSLSTPSKLHEIDKPNPRPTFSVSEASQLFNKIMDDVVSQHTNKEGRCIVPLSGGWDSRILFGAVMDRFPKNKISTLSFGAPGQLDYKIGKKISAHYDINHTSVDLSQQEISWQKLRQSVEIAPWTYTPDAYFNKLAISTVMPNKDDIIVSGFMGGPLTGGHYTNNSPEDEKKAFSKKQRKVKEKWLPESGFHPEASLPPVSDTSPLSPSEQLDICVRQSNCISAIVTPCQKFSQWSYKMGALQSGTQFLTPFTHPEWASYWLHAPKSVKKNQELYLSILTNLYPELSALPSKYSLGAPNNSRLRKRFARSKRNLKRHLGNRLPMLGVRECSGINYLDYDHAFRKREDYYEVIKTAKNILKENNITPWIDIEGLIENHIANKENNGKTFLVLVGLALNLEREGVV
ncbi:asparagine synthase-related protein [Halomonas smyrnensis]|uniref:asparagine synthase-related protein n=1 Tax=Halomonas smyrnensis TaxID=720605 RepID=UPI00178C7D95|nr:asparagine synthase-related protein [Halomonas smyrnensis]